jgi:hypothetical protein
MYHLKRLATAANPVARRARLNLRPPASLFRFCGIKGRRSPDGILVYDWQAVLVMNLVRSRFALDYMASGSIIILI